MLDEERIELNRYRNAVGAVIDAGFPGDLAPADAIYRLAASRDAWRAVAERLAETLEVLLDSGFDHELGAMLVSDDAVAEAESALEARLTLLYDAEGTD